VARAHLGPDRALDGGGKDHEVLFRFTDRVGAHDPDVDVRKDAGHPADDEDQRHDHLEQETFL
jgi:hypothetical protein